MATATTANGQPTTALDFPIAGRDETAHANLTPSSNTADVTNSSLIEGKLNATVPDIALPVGTLYTRTLCLDGLTALGGSATIRDWSAADNTRHSHKRIRGGPSNSTTILNPFVGSPYGSRAIMIASINRIGYIDGGSFPNGSPTVTINAFNDQFDVSGAGWSAATAITNFYTPNCVCYVWEGVEHAEGRAFGSRHVIASVNAGAGTVTFEQNIGYRGAGYTLPDRAVWTKGYPVSAIYQNQFTVEHADIGQFTPGMTVGLTDGVRSANQPVLEYLVVASVNSGTDVVTTITMPLRTDYVAAQSCLIPGPFVEDLDIDGATFSTADTAVTVNYAYNVRLHNLRVNGILAVNTNSRTLLDHCYGVLDADATTDLTIEGGLYYAGGFTEGTQYVWCVDTTFCGTFGITQSCRYLWFTRCHFNLLYGTFDQYSHDLTFTECDFTHTTCSFNGDRARFYRCDFRVPVSVYGEDCVFEDCTGTINLQSGSTGELRGLNPGVVDGTTAGYTTVAKTTDAVVSSLLPAMIDVPAVAVSAAVGACSALDDFRTTTPQKGTWTTVSGTFTVAGGKMTATASAPCERTMDAGFANGRLRVVVALTTGQSPLVRFRYSDASNNWALRLGGSANGIPGVQIYDIIATAATQRANDGVGLAAGEHVVDIVLNGPNISVTVDGIHPLSYSSTFNQTATIAGVYADQTGEYFKDWSFAPAGLGVDGKIIADKFYGDGSTLTGLALATRIPIPLFDYFADVTSTHTDGTFDNIFASTITAARLAANGEKLEAKFTVSYVGSATATRQVKVSFGGTTVIDSGALTFVSGGTADIWVTVYRVSSSSVRVSAEFVPSGLTLQPIVTTTDIGSLTLTNTQALNLTGAAASTGAASGDIVGKSGCVTWLPAT